jgi:enoyl-CoA hydratase
MAHDPIAAEHAQFGQPGGVGLIPGGGGTQRLAAARRRRAARCSSILRERSSRRRPIESGLERGRSPGELTARAEAILHQILPTRRIAVTYSLEAVNRGMETSQAEGLAIEASPSACAPEPGDKTRARVAFPPEARPQFQGR